MSAGGARPPILVLAMGGVFALLIASLVIGSLTTPEFPPYAPTVPAAHPAVVGDSLLGPATSVPFYSVRQLAAAGYLSNTDASDTTNPGVGKWYAYSMLSHLLTSKHHVYGVRTAAGGYAKLELLAYYCRDVGTACLTFRYAYQGNGTRGVAPVAP